MTPPCRAQRRFYWNVRAELSAKEIIQYASQESSFDGEFGAWRGSGFVLWFNSP